MKIIPQSINFSHDPPKNYLQIVENAARLCYKSKKTNDVAAEKLVKNLIKKGHHSVLEHVTISAILKTDRATSHQIVRHRLASYSQLSQRYVDHRGDIEFILPINCNPIDFIPALKVAEKQYEKLRAKNYSPEKARAVLPNATATELVMTANAREWRHIFDLRMSPKAQDNIRYLMMDFLIACYQSMPILFEDIYFKKFSKGKECINQVARKNKLQTKPRGHN